MTQVDVTLLAARIAALESGAAAGTTLASFEGGNFGYQMVDATYNARCRFLIPTRTVRINKALLHFSLQPFRSGAASGAISGGTSVNHTHSYGATTGGESVGHSHTGGGHQHVADNHAHGTPNHQHATGSTDSRSLTPTFGPAYFDGAGATVGVMMGGVGSTAFHTDSSGSATTPLGGAAWTQAGTGGGVQTGNDSAGHTHTAGGVTVGQSVDHSHTLPASTGLYETGMAQGSHVYIDGTDVTSTLGGPWGTGSALDIHDLDVSQWLSAKGWHEVQISSTSLGGIFPSLAIFAVVGV